MEAKVIKIKGKNGTVYLYEDKSYWDKEKGYSTHKRKCIGRLDGDGNPVYNEYYRGREKMRTLEREIEETGTVSTTTMMGQRLVLEKETGRTGVDKPLERVFGKEDASRILALAYYDICRGKAFSRSEQWLEDRGFGGLGLTTQRISELLSRVGRQDKVNTFLKMWLETQRGSGNLLFDITSVSTYGKGNPYAEYGYNRDGERLEQINLALLSSCGSGLPLWYKELKGSMSDKAVLGEVLDELDKYGVGRFTFVGDRGFFTADNLRNLTGHGVRFLVPIPSSARLGRELIAERRGGLVSPANVIRQETGVIYGETVYRMTEHGRTWFHVYFDPVRKDKVTAGFMEKLSACMDELVSGTVCEAHRELYERYFVVKETPKRGRKVSYNDAALKEYLDNDSCYWVLMGTEKRTARQALAEYRERNGVELSFDDLKNLLDMNRLRNHSDATIRGKIFVNFIALVLLSSLRRTVDAIPAKDRKYWSETDMLDRVDTYSRIHFDGKYKDVFTTPTKTQRLVFDLLGIKYVYKGEPKNDDLTPPEEL